jgi:hypothetical protein
VVVVVVLVVGLVVVVVVFVVVGISVETMRLVEGMAARDDDGDGDGDGEGALTVGEAVGATTTGNPKIACMALMSSMFRLKFGVYAEMYGYMTAERNVE